MKHGRKFKKKNETNVEKGSCFFPPAVGVLRGGVPRMCYGGSPDPGPHAHHRRLLLRVPVLRQLWRRDASETEEER